MMSFPSHPAGGSVGSEFEAMHSRSRRTVAQCRKPSRVTPPAVPQSDIDQVAGADGPGAEGDNLNQAAPCSMGIAGAIER